MSNNKLAIAGAGALLFGFIAVSGGAVLGRAVGFDLSTDGYVGTHNFQVTFTSGDLDTINTEVIWVSGAVSESEVLSGSEGGRVRYKTVVLERVYKGVDDFYLWRLDVEDGTIIPLDMEIVMMDSAFNPVRAMVLEGAWPSKWEMPDMDATIDGPALERITLTVERAQEVAP